jgi:hypothetical protein
MCSAEFIDVLEQSCRYTCAAAATFQTCMGNWHLSASSSLREWNEARARLRNCRITYPYKLLSFHGSCMHGSVMRCSDVDLPPLFSFRVDIRSNARHGQLFRLGRAFHDLKSNGYLNLTMTSLLFCSTYLLGCTSALALSRFFFERSAVGTYSPRPSHFRRLHSCTSNSHTDANHAHGT